MTRLDYRIPGWGTSGGGEKSAKKKGGKKR